MSSIDKCLSYHLNQGSQWLYNFVVNKNHNVTFYDIAFIQYLNVKKGKFEFINIVFLGKSFTHDRFHDSQFFQEIRETSFITQNICMDVCVHRDI